MSLAYQHEAHPCSPLADRAGYWKLSAGRALTLTPREWGRLCIAQGRVWLTADVLSSDRAALAGDHVLSAGQSLLLPPGAQVVVEAWERAGGAPVHFQWMPQPSPALTRWQQEVVRPLNDLGRAGAVALQATWRLLAGLTGYAEFLVAGRGRVLSHFESNPP